MRNSDDISSSIESRVIFIAGLIQFVNAVDFIMVMPLGPDFSKALGIPANNIGIIGGIYTFAAGLMGLVGSLFLDNVARKRGILIALAGLSMATLAGALVWDTSSMLVVRMIAGLCGGPLGSLIISLITDIIPPQRRGAAMGKMMGAFSIASVLGLPIGLELARIFSWHAPFIATGLLGWIAFFLTWRFLPHHQTFTNDVLFKHRLINMGKLIKTRIVLLSFLSTIASMTAGFLVIPYLSAHYQLNLHFPRTYLGTLYFFGGIITFFSTRFVGKWLDHSSAVRIGSYAILLLVTVFLIAFILYPYLPVSGKILTVFVAIGFPLAMTTRSVCEQTLFSKIPPPEYRGAYNSLINAVRNFTQAAATYAASCMLVEQGGQLLHIDRVGWVGIVFALCIPLLLWLLEKNLKRIY